MITIYREQKHGRGNHGWLQSWFHFSFADYRNPERIHFGALRVINDDIIAPHSGFDTHPHQDMEIVSYVIDGALTHTDSMGNTRHVTRGDVQYMSAGTGVRHSEWNHGDVPTRLLQIWILPDAKGHAPRYGDHAFPWDNRINRWLHVVSPENGGAPVTLHQDANFYVTYLTKDQTLEATIDKNRQAYLVLIEGELDVNEFALKTRDGLESTGESLSLRATTDAHVLLIDLAQS